MSACAALLPTWADGAPSSWCACSSLGSTPEEGDGASTLEGNQPFLPSPSKPSHQPVRCFRVTSTVWPGRKLSS